MECTDIPYSSNVYYSPSPGSYAVIRLNPVEMIRPFNDPQALLEAQAMRPKSYLIMLQMVRFQIQSSLVFVVEPIATTLRPEDKAQDITSDLCIPIFPNTSHPTGREPVKPEPEGLFPYDNCYHWYDAEMVDVRVRARPEEFDETNAVTLSVDMRVDMETAWEKEFSRIVQIQRTGQAEVPTKANPPREQPTLSSPVPTSAHLIADLQCTAELDDTSSSTMGLESISTFGGRSNHSLDDLAAMDIFSGPNDDAALVPLVDLWISELGDHLKQEDIPSPSEMLAEFEHIAKIVKEARVRSYAALTAHISADDTSSDIKAHPDDRKRILTMFRLCR
ncbi:hypothetical protein ONZ51_g10142 [Trametes cubensis]|uniref:Uncharacterized protein n=1 Tax=Trametes cubensis TaxID=1111947 RepID=A0AAD7X542_9APHY|nr:hypothetical protein ONZ51_g10142 [Trametes cubensis]